MEVRIENLTKIFFDKKGRVEAVNDVSFVVPSGKLVGLLGPSGCGKTTILYLIAGLHEPDAGRIWFDYEDVTSSPIEKRGVGMVFQNYALYPHFSVRRNITFPLDNLRFPGPLDNYKKTIKEAKSKIHKLQKSIEAAQKYQEGVFAIKKELEDTKKKLFSTQKAYEEAKATLVELKKTNPLKYKEIHKRRLSKQEKTAIVRKMAELVGIEKYLDRKPKELSGGEQQRAAIARALVKSPRLLLLDEPFSNLDERLRLETREEIRRIQKDTGITTIFVTHDQEEAQSISDIIVVMNQGVVQQIDSPEKIYDEPQNLFVAKFLGSPPINIFEGEIKEGKLLLNDKIFDEGKIYKKTYRGLVKKEKMVVKGTEVSLEDYLEDLEANPNRLANKTSREIKSLRNPELETVQYEEKVVKRNRKVWIGVRPEAFILETKKASQSQSNSKKGSVDLHKIPFVVQHIQKVGQDISLVGKVQNQEQSSLKIVIPSESWSETKRKEIVNFKAKRFYVFELSGERIK